MNFLKFIKHIFLFLLTFLIGTQTTYAKTELVLPQNQVSFSIEQSQSFSSLEKEVQPNIGFLKEKSKFEIPESVSAQNQHEFNEPHLRYVANAGGDLFSSFKTRFINKLDDIQWSKFETDFGNKADLLKKFDDNPALFDSWNTYKNAGLDDLARDVNVLESYSKVKRVGSYTEHVKPTRVSELTRAHGAPKLGQEADILKHETTFSTTGYDLSKPIPVIELPDGTLLLADGHHRLKAMENLEQVVVPVDKLSIYEAKQLYGEDGVATLVEVAKLSGNYKGTYTGASGLALERAQNAATDFMKTFFPGW